MTKLVNRMLEDDKVALVWADCIIVNSSSERIYWDRKRNSLIEKNTTTFNTSTEFYTINRPDLDLKNIRYLDMLKGNFISNVLLLRTNVVCKLGGYEQGLEDWSMWLKFLHNDKIAHIDECLGAYRWHDSNTIKNLPLSCLKGMFLFLIEEQSFCEKNGYYVDWLKQIIRCARQILKHTKEESSFIKKNLGWRYYFVKSKLLFSLYKRFKY